MATLSIINSFSLSAQGLSFTGKQGDAASALADDFDVTVSGIVHQVVGSLATAAIATVFDSADDIPGAVWDYLFFWADQICYVQVIGSGTNVVFKLAAEQPFVLPGYNKILAAANTTPIAGNTEPTLTTIASVVVGNYSGTTANYLFAVID